MPAITFNPGFALIFAAFVMLATPRGFRAPLMAGAAAFAMWLLLDNDFGAAAAVAQMGLSVVLLNLDALNRVFGIAFLIALVLLSFYSSARNNRFEDTAILLLAGGAVSALFVGDLISFVAAMALAGLSATWLVFASPRPGADRAGVRLLVWHALEGLLFLIGVAFHISSGADNSVFSRLSATSLSGGFIFAALMIRVGAPLAHVWLKDAIGHASGVGGVALAVFASTPGVYALARLFPAEPLLAPVGAAMVVVGLIFAAADDDARRSAAYALSAQLGVCVMLIGIGSPLARSAAEAHVFGLIFAFSLLFMAQGVILTRTGDTRISSFTGVSQALPVTTVFLFLGGLAAACMPGFASYVSFAVALEAASNWDNRVYWTLIIAVSAALTAILALRQPLAAYLRAPSSPPREAAPFPMLLGMGLAAFFCLAVGLNPAWLYRLTPTELSFAPYALDLLAPALETIGAAATAYLLLRAFSLVPRERPIQLLDVDALYRGPLAGAGRWVGIVLLRLYGAWRTGFSVAAERAGLILAKAARACDRPYAHRLDGAIQFAVTAAVLVIILLTHR